MIPKIDVNISSILFTISKVKTQIYIQKQETVIVKLYKGEKKLITSIYEDKKINNTSCYLNYFLLRICQIILFIFIYSKIKRLQKKVSYRNNI